VKGDEGMAIDWENYGRDRYGGGRAQSSTYQVHSRGKYGNGRPVYQEHTYVDGNTVRKASALPRRREQDRSRREPKRYPVRQPVKMPGISGKGFLFLMAMLSAVMFMGFSYLSTQSEVRQMKNEVVAMQTDIAQQRELYEEEYQNIENSVDIAKIYERATKKLKMVYAENNQIYTYSNKKSDLVKQYADIPGAD